MSSQHPLIVAGVLDCQQIPEAVVFAHRPRCGFNRLKTIMSLYLKVRLRHIGLYPMNTRDFDKGGFRGLYTFQRGQFGDKM